MKFDIDANGILSVSAMDKGTGKTQDIKITGASTLSDDEVKTMVDSAEKFADEDRKKREIVDLKNEADSLGYQINKQLEDKDLKDKIPEDVATEIRGKLDAMK